MNSSANLDFRDHHQSTGGVNASPRPFGEKVAASPPLPDLIHAVINAARADEHAFHEWVRGGITGQEREAVREAFTEAVTAVLAAARAAGAS